MWPEVEQAGKLNRHELVLTGALINKRLEESGLDETIFDLENLNYLSITDSTLCEIPDCIDKLANLQTLILHSNKLTAVNESIGKLKKLKVLDLSRNDLLVLGDFLQELVNVVTLNLSHNKLGDFPELTLNVRLTALDLSHNKLTKFPPVCNADFTNLFEIKLNGNEIEEIPNNINVLSSLKLLDLNNNKIKVLNGELADCSKLKDLNLKDNPISDNRLLKLINQCRTKQILDYVRQNCKKTSQEKVEKKTNKNKKQSISNDVNFNIIVQQSEFKIFVDLTVKEVREFIIGCIVTDIKFNDNTLREFIQLQNKLHDTVCDKRNLATIATHDFSKLASDQVTYTTKTPTELKIKPLNRNNVMSGAELFAKLQTEANNLRKEKKRNTYSGIHKYLYLIEGKPKYPCLFTSVSEEAISFPPITNSDLTKISIETTSIFIEVTSSVSLANCRTTADNLLKGMVFLFEKDLNVKQIRVVNPEQELKACYPSKVDLNFDNSLKIGIIRN